MIKLYVVYDSDFGFVDFINQRELLRNVYIDIKNKLLDKPDFVTLILIIGE